MSNPRGPAAAQLISSVNTWDSDTSTPGQPSPKRFPPITPFEQHEDLYGDQAVVSGLLFPLHT